jgi:hypothetical protein
MYRIPRSLAAFVTTLAIGGTCLQVGSCDALGLAASAISGINPCGTILACDPQEYAFITSGIDGPGVRPDIDPFCVYPPFCTADEDPIFGGLAP